MMRVTMLIATLMAVTAVSTSTQITALSANVTFMKIVFLVLFLMWLVTASVMMRQTMSTAIMMKETAVDIVLTLIFVPTVDVISTRLVLLVLIP